MRRLALTALFAVACGALPAHAQTLALAYPRGDVHKYSFQSTSTENIEVGVIGVPAKLDNLCMSGTCLTAHFTALETMTVQSVDSSGVADLTIALSNIVIKAQSNGTTNTTTGLTMPVLEIKIAADGRLLSIDGMSYGNGFPFGMGIGMGSGLISAVLPDTPVKPGDTWSKDYDQANPLGSGAVQITTKSKYLRDESFQGVNAAVVETASSAAVDFTVDPSKLVPSTSVTTPKVDSPSSPAPSFTLPAFGAGSSEGITIKGTTTSDVTTWFDPGDHRILKSHMTGTTADNLSFVTAPGSTIPGMIGPMSIKGDDTVDLLPA